MPEEINPAEEAGQEPEAKLEKKFTTSQTVTILLLSALILLLVGLSIMNFMKKSDDGKATENKTEKAVSSGSENKETNLTPVSETQQTNAASLSETKDEEETKPEEPKIADLYIKSYNFDETPEAGDEFTAKIVIANKGTAAAGKFTWEWWPKDSRRECREEINGLSAGAERLVECDYTYSEPDDYPTKVVVDSKDNIEESNENNNIVAREIEIAEKADLYVSDYDFNHDPVQGEEFTVSITIKNKGETDADSFYWEWWPTITGSKACREKLDGLEAGDSKTVECDYTYGGWANYTTKAVVDADNDVNEGNEGNNAQTKSVTPIH